jgi:hypothetical protein
VIKLSKKQIEEIKKISPFENIKFHGNRKKIGNLPISLVKEIKEKKQRRKYGCTIGTAPKKSDLGKLVELIKWSLQCKDTNYFKILIEGNTGIYYAHPEFKHQDYNKSRVFDKNENTIKYIDIFNRILKLNK